MGKYSQNDEEAVILEILGRRGIGGDQRFLDIGAYDGKTFSNTLALVERGWGGVCVEPTFQAFRALAELHRGRENIELVNCMVEPMKDFKEKGIGLRRFWSSPDAVGTSDPAHMEKWKTQGQFQPIWVTATNLRLLLTQFKPPFAFINLDVEGAATIGLFEDFASAGRDNYSNFAGATVICVESDGGAQTALMKGMAAARGFQLVHTTSENLIFERK